MATDNKQLQSESKQTEEAAKKKAVELTNANEQLRQNVTKLATDNKQLQSESKQAEEAAEKKAAELTKANEQLRQNATKLAADYKQLQSKSEQVEEASDQKVADQTNANEQLTRDVAQLTADHKQIQNGMAERAEASSNGMEGRDEKKPSRVKDVVRKGPWRLKGRGRLLKSLANAGNRLMHARDRERVIPLEDLIWPAKNAKAQSPMQLLNELVEKIVGLNTQNGISDGPDARLETIRQAREEFDANNNTATVNALRVFINAIQTDQGQDDGSLQEYAQDLIDAAQEIINLIAAG